MSEYYYLISSLPMLKEEDKPVTSLSDFMEACRQWLPEAKYKTLETLSLVPGQASSDADKEAVRKWNDWEICLRNRLAEMRGKKLGRDVRDSLLAESDCYSEIERGIQEASSAQNPLEKEKIYDKMRWRRLEDIESGHHFDFDTLCVYKLKLMLREKWAQRDKEAGQKELEKTLDSVYSASGEKENG